MYHMVWATMSPERQDRYHPDPTGTATRAEVAQILMNFSGEHGESKPARSSLHLSPP